MNFLHCFCGVGAVISPGIMAQALKLARWNEGYRWTACIQMGIMLVCVLTLPLYLTVFAVLNIGMPELAYRRIGRRAGQNGRGRLPGG